MASLDVVTLQILRDKENFNKFSRIVPEGLLDTTTSIILSDYARYFKDHPEHTKINCGAFKSAFFGQYHPQLDDAQRIAYKQVLNNCLESKLDPVVRDNWVNNVLEQSYAREAAESLSKYNDGGDIDIIRTLSSLVDKAQVDIKRKQEVLFVEDDIMDLLGDADHEEGLRWRLSCLRDHMRPLVAGDFGILAGRPDSGKTSFLVSELTYMAPQIRGVFGENRPILWLNNEGPGKRIKPRLYQSALNMSLTELRNNSRQELIEKYAKATGGAAILITDVHGKWSYDIEDIVKQVNPALIVYDMIDNIRFGSEIQGARTDQVLEQQYQWARELAVKNDCIGIATSQISNDGDGDLFPTIGMLKDSKTGKQGACDFQIMIGKSNDFNSESCRGIGIVKNKLRVDGKAGDPRAEVIFDGSRARYRDAV